jgi:hypothetical protein
VYHFSDPIAVPTVAPDGAPTVVDVGSATVTSHRRRVRSARALAAGIVGTATLGLSTGLVAADHPSDPPSTCVIDGTYIGGCRQLPGLVDGWFDPDDHSTEHNSDSSEDLTGSTPPMVPTRVR